MELIIKICILVLLLLLIGRIPIGFHLEHLENGLIFKGKLAWFTFDLPTSNEPKKPKKPKKPTKSNQSDDTPKKEKSSPPPITLEQLPTIITIILGGMERLKKNTVINRLDLEIVVGDENPVQAVSLYGIAHTLLGTLWGPLDNFFLIKEGRARVTISFETETMLYGVMVVTLTLAQTINLAVYIMTKGIPMLREMKGSENRGK